MAGALVATSAFPGFGSVAMAAPPLCPDGSPPPCETPDPDPDPPPPDTPPNPPWSSLVSVLDQSEDGYNHSVRGAWLTTGEPRYSTPSGTLTWNDASETTGVISISSVQLPPGPLRGFHLWENSQDVDGSLCRSQPIPHIDPGLASTHVLVAESDTTSQQALDELAAGFVGDASTPEAEIRLDEVSLDAQEGSLALTLRGWMFADGPLWFNAEGDFVYTGAVHLLPSESVDPSQVVNVHADEDHLTIYGEDEDIENEVLPKLRQAVVQKVAGAVNAHVAAQPSVQWFATLGFTVSFREVSVDDAGIHVLPSLCKVD